MKSPDLWNMAEKLENRELSRFRKYLSSPYFNNDEKHLQLFEAVYEQVQEGRCDREALDAILFPYKPFAYTRITNLISDLKKLLEGFFLQENLKADPIREESMLMEVMNERGLNKLFGQSHTRLQKALDSTSVSAEENYLYHFSSASLAYENQAEPAELDKKIKSLHLFYVIAMLRSVCEDLSLGPLIASKNERIPHRFFVDYIGNNYQLYWKERELRMLIRILRIQVEAFEAKHIQSFSKDWEAYGSDLSDSFRAELIRLIGRSEEKLRENDTGGIQKEYLSFYKVLIDGNWIWESAQLTKAFARQIFQLALQEKDADCLNSFLLKIEGIPESDIYQSGNAYFQAAYLHTYLGESREAGKTLRDASFEDAVFGEDIFRLNIQLKYDLYEDQGLENSLNEYQKLLKRNKIPTETRENWQILEKFISKLLKLRTRAQITQAGQFTKKREKLAADIMQAAEFPMKQWLLDKLMEIGKKG